MGWFQEMLERNDLEGTCLEHDSQLENKYETFVHLASKFGMYDGEWHDIFLNGYCKMKSKMGLRELSADDLCQKLYELVELLEELDQNLGPRKSRNPNTRKLVFAATEKIKPNEVLVIMIGECPSPTKSSRGYAFGTYGGPSRSLMQIHKSLSHYVNANPRKPDGNLDGWFQQGVFLINAMLTSTTADTTLAKALVQGLIDLDPRTLVMSLGVKARGIVPKWIRKKSNHLHFAHPNAGDTEYEADYLDNQPFMEANAYLYLTRKTVIDWFGYRPWRIRGHRKRIIISVLKREYICSVD